MSQPATFRDRFASVSAGYAAWRPRYPAALFDFLADAATGRQLAWDCGTGTGQAAVALADPFARVIASDASRRQLAHAMRHPRVQYLLAPADRSPLPPASVDLVTVGQALHWFPLEAFYREARRVLRPAGVLAVWTYGDARVTPEIDSRMRPFLRRIAPWWPPERRLVDNAYADLSLPFPELPAPALEMVHSWRLEHFLGYLRTWSAVVRFRAERGDDPVLPLELELRQFWAPEQTRQITWPLTLRAGRVPDS